MTLAFPPILARLIPRLGSPHDGEVVATARAIERTLKSQKLDWHDVAAMIAPPTQWDYDPRRTESDKARQIRAWLEAVSREDYPNAWVRSFIAGVLGRHNLDRLSKKQIAVVENIIDEAYRRGIRPGREAA
jgi:hypothetical protein